MGLAAHYGAESRMIAPPGAVEYVFDPHVVWALIAVCVALFVLVLMAANPIDNGRKPRR